MKTVAIVQARVGSTRLPCKVLLDLAGRPMIVLMLQRVQKSKTIDQVVLATGQGLDNDLLEKTVTAYGFKVYRGSEDDVLGRYAAVSRLTAADRIVRLTGDNPLMDASLIDRLVTTCAEGHYDYVTNVKPPTWPDGLDISVFARQILEDAHRQATKKSDREHVVPWMWRMTSLEGGQTYRAANVTSNRDLSAYRWTVDEPADYEFMKALAAEMGPERLLASGLEDILAVLEQRPELSAINQGILRDAGYLKTLQAER